MTYQQTLGMGVVLLLIIWFIVEVYWGGGKENESLGTDAEWRK